MSLTCGRSWTSLLLLLPACHSAAALDIPSHERGQTVVLIALERAEIEGPPRVAAAWAHAGHAVSEPLALEEGADLYVLFYELSLSALQLQPGPITLLAEGPRHLPRPAEAWRERAPEPSFQRLMVGDVDALLAQIALPAIDKNDCLAQGGCPAAIEGVDICALDCPDASPDLPHAPVFDWPSDWIPRATPGVAGLPVAAPPLIDRLSCPPDHMQRHGQSACTPVGTACSGRWHPDLAARNDVLFVDPAAAPGGDGTSLAPLQTLADALLLATDGSTIALSRGRHRGAIVDRDVSLIGACTSSSAIDDFNGRALVVSGASVAARDLTLGSLGSDRSLSLEHVIVNGRINATGGQMRIAESALHAAGGSSFLLSGGARAELRQVSVDGASGPSIQCVGGALDLNQVGVVGGSRGVAARNGCALSMDRVQIDLPAQSGDDLVGVLIGNYFDLPPDPDPALLDCQRSPLASQATLRDVTIRGGDGAVGNGVLAFCHVTLDAERLYIAHFLGTALLMTMESSLSLADALIIDDQPTGNDLASALMFGGIVNADMTRLYLETVAGVPVRTRDEGTVFQLVDSVIDTAQPGSITQIGVELREASTILERVIVKGGGHNQIHTDQDLRLTDVAMLDTERGLDLQFEGKARDQHHGRIERLEVGARGDLTFELNGCDPLEGFNTPCNPIEISGLTLHGGGTGLRAGTATVLAGGSYIENFAFTGHATAGVHLLTSLKVVFRHGVIKNCGVGFLLEGEGQDPDTLLQDVRIYGSNGIELRR